MTAVGGVLWLGMLLGVGAALSVGPIFVVIWFTAASAVAFVGLAVTLVARDVLPRLG